MTIHAIFRNGVFQPEEKVDLAENTRVIFEPEVVREVNLSPEGMEDVYEVLSHRYDSGDPHGSERHNEHQP